MAMNTVPDEARCTARSKQSGERCRRRVTPGYRVCYYHGANPKNHGGCPPEKAKGNLNALTHGFFAKRILNEDEQRLFDGIVAHLHADFVLNESSDLIAVEAIGLALVQYSRAMQAGNAQAAETFDRMVPSHLKDLKATKIAREGEAVSLQTTPAEWATALLEEIRGRRGKPRRAVQTPETGKTPKESQI